MTELLLHKVERVRAPEGYQRDRAIQPSGLAPDSHLKYDFDTLFYQATRSGGDVVLVAPKLLNFKGLIRECRFSIAGQSFGAPRIFPFYRHAIIRFKNAPQGARLKVEFPDGSAAETPICPEQLDFLSGSNAQMIVSKDNDLRWVREQLTFHVRKCGLQSVCFIDNGSTAYDLDELGEALCSVGLHRAVLVSMPYKWGGMNIKPTSRELYLQTAAYNIVRLQFLAKARAVVRLDIDEILLPRPTGETVFDLAVRARLGFVRFVGMNRLASNDVSPPVQFADHTWINTEIPVAGNNWCLNPRGPLGRFQWRCHNLEHNILSDLQMLKGDFFYHCLGIGTGWKGNSRLGNPEILVPDPQAEEFWRDQFGPSLAGDASQGMAATVD